MLVIDRAMPSAVSLFSVSAYYNSLQHAPDCTNRLPTVTRARPRATGQMASLVRVAPYWT